MGPREDAKFTVFPCDAARLAVKLNTQSTLENLHILLLSRVEV